MTFASKITRLFIIFLIKKKIKNVSTHMMMINLKIDLLKNGGYIKHYVIIKSI